MTYKLSDCFESGIGAFTAMLLFFTLRSDPVIISPKVGFVITLIVVYIYSKSRINPSHLFMNLLVVILISGAMSLAFNLATMNQLLSFEFFGSSAVVGVWLGLPSAIIMDKFNIKNILRRSYVR